MKISKEQFERVTDTVLAIAAQPTLAEFTQCLNDYFVCHHNIIEFPTDYEWRVRVQFGRRTPDDRHEVPIIAMLRKDSQEGYICWNTWSYDGPEGFNEFRDTLLQAYKSFTRTFLSGLSDI